MRRSTVAALLLGSLLLAGLTAIGAERSAFALTPAAQAQVQPRTAFQVGEPLFVEWHGSWWPARVLSLVDADRAVIHYDGYGPEWDEVVASKRALRDGGRVAALGEGASVFIEWRGSWWPAKIRAVKTQGWFIRYDGYGPEWDETVGPSRIKVLK
jgi:hypothetical protein